MRLNRDTINLFTLKYNVVAPVELFAARNSTGQARETLAKLNCFTRLDF